MKANIHSNQSLHQAMDAVGDSIGVDAKDSFSTNRHSSVFAHRCPRRFLSITKYRNHEQLRRSRLLKDPHVALREELQALKETFRPRDAFSVLSDSVVQTIISYFAPVSREVSRLGGTCHRLRCLCLRFVVPEAVYLVPEMIPHQKMSDLNGHVESSLSLYFDLPARRVRMRRLCIVDIKRLPTPFSQQVGLLLDPKPTLEFVSRLPYLSFLDVRGVRWIHTAQNNNTLQRFLEDLYLVAPSLEVLKVDPELLNSWATGWWTRHPYMHTFVVGSRWCKAARSSFSPLILPDDLFGMLSALDSTPSRLWTLKVWCPVSSESLRQFFAPEQPLSHLQVLVVNVVGNCPATESKEKNPNAFFETVFTDFGQGKILKNKRVGSPGGEAIEPMLFPALHSLTLVDAEEHPLVAVGVFARVLTMSPNLQSFTVCNRIGVPSSSPAKD